LESFKLGFVRFTFGDIFFLNNRIYLSSVFSENPGFDFLWHFSLAHKIFSLYFSTGFSEKFLSIRCLMGIF